MKKSKIDISLNDSDDGAFLFENTIQKRKIKPISPKVKRKRGNNTDILTRSAIDNSIYRETKSLINQSAPEPSTKVILRTNNPKDNDLPNIECGNSNNDDFINSSIISSENHGCVKNSEVYQKSTDGMQNSKAKSNKNEVSHFFSKIKTGVTSLTCPLCKKTFENSFSHVSHMKQCAKKKKVSTTQLLRAIDQMNKGIEIKSDSHLAVKPSASKTSLKKSHEPDEDLALATALSISLNHGNVKNIDGSKKPAIDKDVIDSQKATLEKFGFTSSTGIFKPGNRRGKFKLNRNTILKSRTTEERLRLLTEKAAVILLTDENISPEMLDARKPTPDSENEEIPSSLERSKQTLWDIGNCDISHIWYIDDLKEYIAEKTSDTIISQSPDLIDDSNDNIEIPLTPISTQIPNSPVESNTIVTNPLNLDSTVILSTETTLTAVKSLNPVTSSNPDLAVEEKNPEPIFSNHLNENNQIHYYSTPNKRNSPSKNDKPGTLSEDWGKLVGNSLFSDGTIKTKDGEVNIHSLVLHIRCPGLDIDSLQVPCLEINKPSLLIFLKYLYTGIFEDKQITIPEQLIQLSKLFNRPELATMLNEKKPINNENISASAFTPKQADISNPKLNLTMNFEDPHLSEADTVPVSISPHDVSLGRSNSIVDLTQNGNESSNSDNEDPAEQSYWTLLHQNKELEDERLDIIEKENEFAKIKCFFERKSSENIELESDKDFVIDCLEREKINSLSRSCMVENDIFESNEDDIQVLTPIPKQIAEIVNVSSDSDQRIFDESTDDEASNHPIDDFNVPFFEPPENNDFIDYNKTSNLSVSPSQSFIAAPITPRTPRKILESPVPYRSTSPQSPPDFVGEGPENVERNSLSTDATPKQPSLLSPHVTPVSIIIDKGLPGPSHENSNSPAPKNSLQRLSLLSPNTRARRSLLKSNEKNGAALSESVVAALDETWQAGGPSSQNDNMSSNVTPTSHGQFIEVTPHLTPSAKMVNKITPRPGYSSMKTGSIKKHLQKYGLKQSLGKVKARKILRHIYDELHPYVNPKTGKFIKQIPNEEKKKISPKTDSPTKRKNVTNVISNPKPSSSQHSSGKSKNEGGDDNTELAFYLETEENDKLDLLSDSSHVDLCESDGSEDDSDFAGNVLTQPNLNVKGLSTDEILLKFINESEELHEQILKFQPIWIEPLKKDVYSAYNVRLKKKDLIQYLEKNCITFKSEVDAATTKKRNDKKKERCLKKKNKKTTSASQ